MSDDLEKYGVVNGVNKMTMQELIDGIEECKRKSSEFNSRECNLKNEINANRKIFDSLKKEFDERAKRLTEYC